MTRSGRGNLAPISGGPSDEPRPLWPDGVLYHGSRLLLIVGVAAVVTALFPPMGRSTVGRYTVGMVLTEPVIAEVPFVVPKSIAQLQRERADAAAGMSPTFDFRSGAADTMALRLGRFFDQIDTIASAGDAETLRRFLLGSSVVSGLDQATLLMNEETRLLLRTVSISGARQFAVPGITDASQARELTAERVLIQNTAAGGRRSVASDDILSGREFQDHVVNQLMTPSPELSELLRLIMIRHTVYSLEFNASTTEADREQARQAVSTTKGDVVQQEAIVRANEPITREDLERLNAYEAELRQRQQLQDPGLRFGVIFGAFLLNLTILAVFGVLVYFIRPLIYDSLRWLVLQAGLVVAYFALARLVASNGLPPEALPLAFVTLTVAVLWDSRIALVMGLVLAVLTVAQSPFAATAVLFPTMVGGAAAAMSVRVVRRRAQTWVFVAIITGSYVVTLLALALLDGLSAGPVAVSMGWAGANAALSALIAMGFMPVFEWFTGITTDQTLLEWADPNRSLLRRLSLEAPGSYAHTINVANLGEMAANAIGAHGLLCRVGLYYHDVGKVLKPHYFVENQPEGRHPHDKLKPDTSASIVREHVTEGLRLAREEKLPNIVLNFIAEHHGTQLIAFFHARAKDEFGEDNVDEADFRYPGPKPQSKETAIAMMADSIESATRVLQEPTPERVRGLVDGIVEGKREDGQLDEAPLTLREITVLKDTFVKVLSGIYHHRIDYPTTQHLTEAPGSRASKAEKDAVADAGTVSEPADRSTSGADDSSISEGADKDDAQMELGAVTDEGV